jgi:hypothetical protein
MDPREQPNPLAPTTAEPEEETVDETSTLLTKEFTASQVTALRGEFGSSSIKWVMAKLTESPANWHQTTVFVCTSDNLEDRRERWWLFLGSIMMVLFQCAAAIGALRNTQNRSCANNEQCDAVMGMYCEDFTFQDLGGRKKSIGGTGIKQANRCTYCGRSTPVPLQINLATGQVYNRGMDGRTSSESPPLPREFIRSGYEWQPGETYWRHYWLDVKDVPGTNVGDGPSGLTEDARANPVVVTALTDAGWNWTTVEWVCTHPGAGHSATAANGPIERNRSPLSAEYVRNWVSNFPACGCHLCRRLTDRFTLTIVRRVRLLP